MAKKTSSEPDVSSELDRLLTGGETTQVEFKTDVNDGELTEVVVCLANSAGGTLLIGVADDGTVRGARPRHGAGAHGREARRQVRVEGPQNGRRVEEMSEPILPLESYGRAPITAHNSHHAAVLTQPSETP
jgi:predicted HTH transcriptional regulator